MRIEDFISMTNSKPVAGGNKSLLDLVKGDCFKALIKDIQPNVVTLRLDSGELLNARSLILPEARIGEEAVFIVKDNANGQILLEMQKSQGDGVKDVIIKEALTAAGMDTADENTEVLRTLMSNNLPLDKETVQKAVYFRLTQPDLTDKEIAFLIKEQIPPSEGSLAVFNRISKGTLSLRDELKNLADEILNISDRELKKALASAILNKDTETFDNNRLRSALYKKISLPFSKENPLKNLNGFFKELGDVLKKLTETASKTPEREITKQISQIKDSLLFMSHSGHEKIFMQIPMFFNDTLQQAELTVLKDGKRALKDRATVFLSLDLLNLGKVEVFVEKDYRNLSIDFWTENNPKLLKERLPELGLMLNRLGYKITALNLRRPEKITLTTGPDNKPPEPPRRYSFDMRV